MITTVIFDMDGVIIDSEPIHFEIEKKIFEELGIDISLHEHYSFVGTSSQNMWEQIVKKYNLPNSAKELTKRDKDLYLNYLITENNLQPIPGVSELIKELYTVHYSLVLASSASMDNIDMVLAKFNLFGFFQSKISGAELQYAKPHPEIFLEAAKSVGADPGTCLVIEDSENGITAAKAAGMKCIGFINPNSGPQNLALANMTISSFQEVNIALLGRF